MALDPLDPSALLATPEERLQSRLKSANRQLDQLHRSSLNKVAHGRLTATDDTEIIHDLTGGGTGISDPGPVGNTPAITLAVNAGSFLRVFAEVAMRSQVGAFPGGEAYVFLTVSTAGSQRILRWVNGNVADFTFATLQPAPGSTSGIIVGNGFAGELVVPIYEDGEVTAKLTYQAGGDPNTVAHFKSRKLWVELV